MIAVSCPSKQTLPNPTRVAMTTLPEAMIFVELLLTASVVMRNSVVVIKETLDIKELKSEQKWPARAQHSGLP